MASQSVGRSLTPTFTYQRLDLSIDGIRLLLIEPATDSNAIIRCQLKHVAFSQKPKYEALSYTWGSEAVRCKISVDEKDFEVGQNLFNALKHIRDHSNSRALWVDAICINQLDVSEKSHQISIMPFIYMRAKCVLIWLGVPQDEKDQPLDQEEDSPQSSSSVGQDENDRLHALCNNPYWKRVWIIQEIGLARRLRILYGAHTIEWTIFINKIQGQSKFKDSLPMRLHYELDQKYDNSHNLQHLIMTHQESLCKEPRDHIYGFVGLAVDSQEGFPIDYGKTPYEVWKDVIRFKNASQPKDLESRFSDPAIDTLLLGRVVLGLLGGPNVVAEHEVTRDIDLSIQQGLPRGEILLPAVIAGKIVHLGPSHQELVSNLKAVASWRAAIYQYIRGDVQPLAREESDLFLQLLEDAEEDDLNIASSFDREILFPKSHKPQCMVHVDRDSGLVGGARPAMLAESSAVSDDPRLFLLGGVAEYRGGSVGRLGLAPANARVDDYVFLIHGIEKAIVVRYEEKKIRVVGTAVCAPNQAIARDVRTSTVKLEKISRTVSLESKEINAPDRLDIFVDIATAYQLMN